MAESIYAPPEAEISAPAGTGPRYYVVGLRKFMLLSVLTMGFYFIYWMYKNWQQIKLQDNNNSWPVARAIFMIFWTHSLLNDVDRQLKSEESDYDWNPALIATVFVTLSVLSNISDRILSAIYKTSLPPIGLQMVLILIPIVLAIVMRPAQAAINTAGGDADGASNAKLSAANWVWLLVGGTVWALALFGVYGMYYLGM